MGPGGKGKGGQLLGWLGVGGGAARARRGNSPLARMVLLCESLVVTRRLDSKQRNPPSIFCIGAAGLKLAPSS